MHRLDPDSDPSGIGLGFRYPHAGEILRDLPDVPWFEVISDDLLLSSTRFDIVSRLRAHYPIALHSLGINIGGADALDENYLHQLEALNDRLQPRWVSDHLCWCANAERQHFDLLPMPFSEHQLDHVASRIHRVQDIFKQPLVLENISYYVRFDLDEMTEWEFHAELCNRTGCSVLLDLNNLWTNAINFDIDPDKQFELALKTLNSKSIRQLHLAGSTQESKEPPLWIDAHGARVMSPVINMFEKFSKALPDIPSIIERDNDIPAFAEMKKERDTLHARIH